jgi:hypothetical protein
VDDQCTAVVIDQRLGACAQADVGIEQRHHQMPASRHDLIRHVTRVVPGADEITMRTRIRVEMFSRRFEGRGLTTARFVKMKPVLAGCQVVRFNLQHDTLRCV